MLKEFVNCFMED